MRHVMRIAICEEGGFNVGDEEGGAAFLRRMVRLHESDARARADGYSRTRGTDTAAYAYSLGRADAYKSVLDMMDTVDEMEERCATR